MIKINPIGKYVLIEPEKEEDTTASGVVIVRHREDKPDIGVVVAVGDEVRAQIKPGLRVIFKKYEPDEIEIDETKYLICEDESILAVLKEVKSK